MKKLVNVSAITIGAVFLATQAFAQAQPKAEPESKTPAQSETPKNGSTKQRSGPDQQGKSTEPKSAEGETTKRKAAEGNDDQGKKGETKSQAVTGDGKTGNQSTEPKSKQSQQKSNETPSGQQKSTAGAPSPAPSDPSKSNSKAATSPSNPSQTGQSNQPTGTTTERVQLSEQQRSGVGSTILKESNVNRATNVSITVNVGTALPREVRLEPLPAAVISLVPAYRTYRYVVINEQICIVEPTSFTIVEVLNTRGERQASAAGGTQGVSLVLSPDEEMVVLEMVEVGGGSNLGLDAFSEGAPAPRNAKLVSFPAQVIERVAKLKDYQYFSVENRIAIVGPDRHVIRILQRKS